MTTLINNQPASQPAKGLHLEERERNPRTISSAILLWFLQMKKRSPLSFGTGRFFLPPVYFFYLKALNFIKKNFLILVLSIYLSRSLSTIMSCERKKEMTKDRQTKKQRQPNKSLNHDSFVFAFWRRSEKLDFSGLASLFQLRFSFQRKYVEQWDEIKMLGDKLVLLWPT